MSSLIHSAFKESTVKNIEVSHLLAMKNKAAVNMRVHITLWDPVFNFLSGSVLRSGIVELYGSSIFETFEEYPHCCP